MDGALVFCWYTVSLPMRHIFMTYNPSGFCSFACGGRACSGPVGGTALCSLKEAGFCRLWIPVGICCLLVCVALSYFSLFELLISADRRAFGSVLRQGRGVGAGGWQVCYFNCWEHSGCRSTENRLFVCDL